MCTLVFCVTEFRSQKRNDLILRMKHPSLVLFSDQFRTKSAFIGLKIVAYDEHSDLVNEITCLTKFPLKHRKRTPEKIVV